MQISQEQYNKLPERLQKHFSKGNIHPTIKNVKLMEYLATMCSREGSTILDPFMGSGTTGVACKNLNRNFIGIELDKEYYEIAKKRIENTTPSTQESLSTNIDK